MDTGDDLWMLDKLPIHGTPVVTLAMLLCLINHRFIIIINIIVIIIQEPPKDISICYSYRQ